MVWNVYWDSSCMRLGSTYLDGFAVGIGERRGVEALAMAALRVETSFSVEPMRVIFLERRSLRGREGFLKGGWRRPSLGVIRNFWLERGMERSDSIFEERSVRTASLGNDRLS